jgi:undecaprenyl-phosphate 4-deoxy-4-formamido-L-arabinose transferase
MFNRQKLSIVIPVYNSAATIFHLFESISSEIRPRVELELILVNDGSFLDNSADICRKIALENDWVVYIELARNFGEHNAVMAGLHETTGDYVVVMDDDLQNPPGEVIRLVEKLVSADYDVVFSFSNIKKHSHFRNLGSSFNNLVASVLLNKPRNLYLSSFKAMRRSLVRELIKYDNPFPYIDGLILRLTRHYCQQEVSHNERAAGKSNYSIWKLVNLWLHMLTGFSILPLRIASIIGILLSVISGFAIVFIVVQQFLNPDAVAGWASTIVVILFVASIQLMSVGIMGEYLGRALLKLNQAPQFIVRRTFRLKNEL